MLQTLVAGNAGCTDVDALRYGITIDVHMGLTSCVETTKKTTSVVKTLQSNTVLASASQC